MTHPSVHDQPFTPPSDHRLAVGPWPDAVIDRVGHDPRARYVEQFWLGVIGPTALWFLRALAWRFDDNPEGFSIEVTDLSASLGLGRGTGKSAPLARTMARCARFDLLRTPSADVVEVRRRLPALSLGRVARLPEELQIEHLRWQREQFEQDHAEEDRVVGPPSTQTRLGGHDTAERAEMADREATITG